MRPGIKEVYFPAPTARARPEWFDIIADEVLRNVLDKLYAALNARLKALASIGVRTLLDRAGYLLIGDPRGGFEGKLSALQTGGHISAQEKTTLEAVADAGNASAHRGYTPTVERLGRIDCFRPRRPSAVGVYLSQCHLGRICDLAGVVGSFCRRSDCAVARPI
ncbi:MULTISPECIES: DUF4145 domain-containing protein [Rhizobium/Agrobacterium group]